ncbi:hypothetical protein C8J57DRAFT_1470038 [Mycena rebaudengoi]|nr:hypothetical protein C8J57DRAFT_1470038 [Mycena rebaudengoi]
MLQNLESYAMLNRSFTRNSVGSLLWPFFLHYRCTSRPLFLNLMVNTCAFKIQAICGPDTGFGEIKIGTLQDLNLHLRLFHSQIFPFGDSKLGTSQHTAPSWHPSQT